jgi:hypothetical protein
MCEVRTNSSVGFIHSLYEPFLCAEMGLFGVKKSLDHRFHSDLAGDFAIFMPTKPIGDGDKGSLLPYFVTDQGWSDLVVVYTHQVTGQIGNNKVILIVLSPQAFVRYSKKDDFRPRFVHA